MVRIRPVRDNDLPALTTLTVAKEQIKYVGIISENMAVAPPSSHFHVIADNETLVGFFNLDTVYGFSYPFAQKGELGLRAFLIDSSQQGRGLGKAAVKALKNYLNSYYPQYPSICLTVNCKNPSAYHCYLSGGFEDTGELYHGGLAGPQHVMRMKLTG